MSLRTTTQRRSVTTSAVPVYRRLLLCLLLTLCLAPFSGAGDPDDDWGLPSMSAGDAGGSQSASAQSGSNSTTSSSSHALSTESDPSALQAGTHAVTESSLSLSSHPDAVFSHAFLVLDDGDEATSLQELLLTDAGRTHVNSLRSLGYLASLDVARMQKLVSAQAELLQGQRVSVVIVSSTAQGDVHLSAVRLTPEVSVVELFTN